MSDSVGSVEPLDLEFRQLSGAILLDVREHQYFAKGHLPSAINISINSITMRIPEIIRDKDQEIICYCNGGTRGPRAASALVALGYSNVSVLAGGLRAYMAQREQ